MSPARKPAVPVTPVEVTPQQQADLDEAGRVLSQPVGDFDCCIAWCSQHRADHAEQRRAARGK